jgi:predicted Zn-dependent peptidase
VRSLTTTDICSFFDSRYRTGNTVVAVAGAVDPDEVIDRIAQCFDQLPVGDGRVPRHEPEPRSGCADRARIADDTEQVHLVTGGRALAREDDDREALDVANHVLGGGLSSRLFDEIRERRGLAYSVFSSAAAYADTGAWSVYAGTLPEHALEVERLIGHELDRLADGITADELEIAQGYLAGSYEMGLEDSGARMSRLGGQLTLLGRLRSVEEQIERWSAVTLADVERVIERVYGGATLTISVGPD